MHGNTQQSTTATVCPQIRLIPAVGNTCKVITNSTRRTHKRLAKNQGKFAKSHQIDISRAIKEVSGVPQAHPGPSTPKLEGTPGLFTRTLAPAFWSLKSNKTFPKNTTTKPPQRAKNHSSGTPEVHHSIAGHPKVTLQSGEQARMTAGSTYPGQTPIGNYPTKLNFPTKNERNLEFTPPGPPPSPPLCTGAFRGYPLNRGRGRVNGRKSRFSLRTGCCYPPKQVKSHLKPTRASTSTPPCKGAL